MKSNTTRATYADGVNLPCDYYTANYIIMDSIRQAPGGGIILEAAASYRKLIQQATLDRVASELAQAALQRAARQASALEAGEISRRGGPYEVVGTLMVEALGDQAPDLTAFDTVRFSAVGSILYLVPRQKWDAARDSLVAKLGSV